MDESLLARVDEAIREVAARELLPRFRRLGPGDVRAKGPDDVVTVADFASEAALTAALRAIDPGADVVGEESVESSGRPWAERVRRGRAWVVDPLDGTANFAAGDPAFGVIVALVEDGRVRAGWIHDPVAGRTLAGGSGFGARLDGRPVSLFAPRPLADAVGVVATRFLSPEMRTRADALARRLRTARPSRCSATDYFALLAGEVQVALYGRTLPWDHAAGVALWESAGGAACRFDGGPYDPAIGGGGLLLARDADALGGLRAVVGRGATAV